MERSKENKDASSKKELKLLLLLVNDTLSQLDPRYFVASHFSSNTVFVRYNKSNHIPEQVFVETWHFSKLCRIKTISQSVWLRNTKFRALCLNILDTGALTLRLLVRFFPTNVPVLQLHSIEWQGISVTQVCTCQVCFLIAS